MKMCHVPSLFLCITRMFLFFYFILSVTSFQLSDRGHPHLGNASDHEVLLGFMSAVTYDASQSLRTAWKPNVSFCEWTGVICSGRRQRVVSINVSSMGLEEYGLGGCVTTKGDVYSYGVVLLEMLTGKKPTNNMFVEGMNLKKWVLSGFPNQVGEVVDSSLLKRTSTTIEEDEEHNCLNQLISVGLLCTKESPEGRPTMLDIVGALQKIKDTFLGAVGIPKFQSDITHLLASTSTSCNNIGEGQSSSTL